MSRHPYLPHTEEDIQTMLGRCGATTLDDLYADVPDALRLKETYRLPAPMSEPELEQGSTTIIPPPPFPPLWLAANF